MHVECIISYTSRAFYKVVGIIGVAKIPSFQLLPYISVLLFTFPYMLCTLHMYSTLYLVHGCSCVLYTCTVKSLYIFILQGRALSRAKSRYVLYMYMWHVSRVINMGTKKCVFRVHCICACSKIVIYLPFIYQAWVGYCMLTPIKCTMQSYHARILYIVAITGGIVTKRCVISTISKLKISL